VVEIELKFQLPAAARDAVRTELTELGGQLQRLQAAYVDTPTRHLAQARAALRLRREDAQWVQTLKAQGAGVMKRLEHNAELPPDAGEALPPLDLARHAGTPAAAALAAALGVDEAALAAAAAQGETLGLAVVFETDVRRTLAQLPAPGGAWVEAALDEGEIRAAGHRLALGEVELELRTGEPAGLLALAGEWVARHGLWLDTRSKAERGEGLARGPQTVSALRPVQRPDNDQPVPAQVNTLLVAVLANGSVLADEALAGGDRSQHLRHWHRGLGELLHALGVAALAGVGPQPHPDWAGQLIELLAPLDAGAGPTEAVAGRVARSARYNQLMLNLLGWSAPL
jgi:inorganic triphosphatase YgiF